MVVVQVQDRAHQHPQLLRYSPAIEDVGNGVTVAEDGHRDRPVGVESSMKYVYKSLDMYGGGVIPIVTDVGVVLI
jgi:hypothetical protein